MGTRRVWMPLPPPGARSGFFFWRGFQKDVMKNPRRSGCHYNSCQNQPSIIFTYTQASDAEPMWIFAHCSEHVKDRVVAGDIPYWASLIRRPFQGKHGHVYLDRENKFSGLGLTPEYWMTR